MFKYNMKDITKLIGDEEIPGEIVDVGEEIIDEFNNGNDGVLNRLVDAVNGVIPGYVSLATLQSEVAASADFADFQARIAAL